MGKGSSCPGRTPSNKDTASFSDANFKPTLAVRTGPAALTFHLKCQCRAGCCWEGGAQMDGQTTDRLQTGARGSRQAAWGVGCLGRGGRNCCLPSKPGF